MFLVAFSIFSAVILFAVAKVRQLIRIGKEMQGAGQNLKTQTSDTQQLTTKEPERGDCHHFLVLIFSHLLPTLHLFFEKFEAFHDNLRKTYYLCRQIIVNKHNAKCYMDVAFLLDKYFKGAENVSIDVFDAQTLNTVYKDVINAMTSHFEIEVSVLQALSYCLYEMMDNVHIHSGKPLGTAITYYDNKQKTLRILIADDGMGIQASLAQNNDYKDITESEALKMCLEDKITDGKGMGFGLYTTSRLVDNIGKEFILHSGSHKLITKNGQTEIIENGFGQGTLIYMEIGTGEEIDPSQIVDHRADAASEYNETFVETEELDSLW